MTFYADMKNDFEHISKPVERIAMNVVVLDSVEPEMKFCITLRDARRSTIVQYNLDAETLTDALQGIAQGLIKEGYVNVNLDLNNDLPKLTATDIYGVYIYYESELQDSKLVSTLKKKGIL